MVHDWFVHKKGAWTHTHDIPVDDGDAWHERPMRVPKTPADPPKVAGLNPAARLHQREHPLVGRLAGVWQQPRQPGVAPRRARRQGAGQPQRAARRGSGHRPRDHRLHRERLGRSEPAARAVCARAQRHLRRAQAAQPDVGRRAPVPAGPPRQCGAAGEDPHGGVVDGHPAGRDHHRRAANQLVRRAREAAERVHRRSTTTICSAAFPARRPITPARRFR